MAITKIQTGGIPALAVTHDKLHTTMDLSGKTVTLPTLTALDVTNNIVVGGTVDGIDIAARDAVLTSTTTTATAALPKAGGTMTGAIIGTTASFTRLDINATNTQLKGDLFAHADGAYDIGASGANRPRNLYLSNSIVAGDITTTGTATATSFIGSGAALTNLPSDVTVSTTAPSSPSAGDLWFDSTVGTAAMKVYSGSSWDTMSNKFTATGGTIATFGAYKLHVFTSSGTFIAEAAGVVDVLVVAGGGGSGGDVGSGGGAGGLIWRPALPIASNSFSVIIGAGGSGNATGGTNGGNSSVFGLTAIGGGHGAQWNRAGDNQPGGSGGGGSATHTGTSVDPGEAGTQSSQSGESGSYGYGNSGGSGGVGTGPHYGGGGGGGGAGAVGGSSSGGNSGVTAGAGGQGKNMSAELGTSVGDGGWFAGGGAAVHDQGGGAAGGQGGGATASTSSTNDGTPGDANTGGGASGGSRNSQNAIGGSGIVIVRYGL